VWAPRRKGDMSKTFDQGKLVYEHYGLTEDEIAIIEKGATK
jgi:hypothetical protein